MDESLKWMFQLFDGVSDPASKITSSLKQITVSMGEGKSVTAAFGDVVKSQTPGLFAFGTALGGWTAFIKEAIDLSLGLTSAVVSLGEAGAKAAFAFGKSAVGALAYKESTLASFNLILGSEDEAQKTYKLASDFARITPFHTQDVVGSFKQLLSAGFTQEEVPIVFQGISDVAAASGFDKEIMDRLAYVFGQIKASGHLMGHQLMEITRATAGAGVGRQQIFDELGKQLHVSSENVQAMVSSDQVGAADAIFAVLSAIKDKTGELGKTTLVQSTTLKGLFSTLEDTWEAIFNTFDLTAGKTQGFDIFKSAIQNLVTLFDTGTASGRRLADFINGVFNDLFTALFGQFAGDDGSKRLAEIFDKVLGFAQDAWSYVMTLIGAFEIFWETIAPLRGMLMDMFKDGAASEDFKLAVMEIAYFMGEIVNMLGLATPLIWNMVTAGNALTGILGSPSAIVGIASLFGGGDDEAPARKPAVHHHHHEHQVSVPITVNAPGAKGDELARDMHKLLPGAIAHALERMATESGGQETPK